MVICGSEEGRAGTGGPHVWLLPAAGSWCPCPWQLRAKPRKTIDLYISVHSSRDHVAARLTFEKGVKCAMLMRGANAAATASFSTSSSTSWYGILVTRWWWFPMLCNDSHIVLVHMHYHCWVEYLLSCAWNFFFVSSLFPSSSWLGLLVGLQLDAYRSTMWGWFWWRTTMTTREGASYSSASSLLSSSRRCFLLFL